jgi:hypothetical protein
VPRLIEAAVGNDWTSGAAILTFLFPMLLFIGVASALYVLYTKPHVVPGHRYQVTYRTVSATGTVRVPGPVARPTPGGGTVADAGQQAGDENQSGDATAAESPESPE